MTKIFTALLVIASLMFATACPKAKKAVRQFRELNAELLIQARNLNTVMNEAFKDGTISRDTLAVYGKADDVFNAAIKQYMAMTNGLEKIASETGEIPKDKLDAVDRFLQSNVIKAFFELASQIELTPAAVSKHAEVIQATISSIRLILLQLRGLFAEAVTPLTTPTGNREVIYV